MPRNNGKIARRLFLSLALAIALLAFTPISHALLRAVNGSFAPTPYTSLALRAPSDAVVGVKQGVPVHVELTNRSGQTRTYRWLATEAGALIGTGLDTLPDGRSETIAIPTRHTSTGRLRVGLDGTNIYVAVPILKS
jgi:hypothetical protein